MGWMKSLLNLTWFLKNMHLWGAQDSFSNFLHFSNDNWECITSVFEVGENNFSWTANLMRDKVHMHKKESKGLYCIWYLKIKLIWSFASFLYSKSHLISLEIQLNNITTVSTNEFQICNFYCLVNMNNWKTGTLFAQAFLLVSAKQFITLAQSLDSLIHQFPFLTTQVINK